MTGTGDELAGTVTLAMGEVDAEYVNNGHTL